MKYRTYSLIFKYLLGISTLFVCCQLAHAAGSIKGRVLNKTTNSFLENARVIVDGTGFETYTDDGGFFSIENMPAGKARVTVTFTGFRTESKEVEVFDSKTTEIDFSLVLQIAQGEDTVLLDKYTVVAERLGAEASALNEQRMAVNLKNVVAFEEFGEMGDANAAEFLKYVPGVNAIYSPNYANSVSIRGLPTGATLVMSDGNELASSAGDRQFEMSGAMVANIDRLEVTKSPLPDMPANAIGGSVNIIGKSGFNSKVPVFNYNIFYTWNYNEKPAIYNPSPLEKRHGGYSKLDAQGISPGVTLSYLVPFNRSFAITLNAEFSDRYYPMDYCYRYWDYDKKTYYQFLKYLTDQIIQKRLGSLAFEWKPGRHLTVKLTAQYSTDDSIINQTNYNLMLGASRTGTAETMSNTAADGTISWAANGFDLFRTNQLYRAAFKYDASNWIIESDIAYSSSKRERKDFDDGFLSGMGIRMSGLSLRADGMSKIMDGYVPNVTASKTVDGPHINPFDASDASFNTYTLYDQLTENSVINSRLHIKRDFATAIPLSLKIGIAYNENSLDKRLVSQGYTANGTAPTIGAIDGIGVELSRQNRWRYRDGSRVDAWWPGGDELYRYVVNNPDAFAPTAAQTNAAYQYRINNSMEITETVAAGFLRFDTRFFSSRVRVAGGVRYERTTDAGSGPANDITNTYEKDAYGNIVYVGSGTNMKPKDIPNLTALQKSELQYTERAATTDASYGGFFPSLNISWSLTPNIILRTTYARTISRPPMSYIIPYVSIREPLASTTEPGEPEPEPDDPSWIRYTIDVGNPNLKPWTANNYDISFETYNLKGITFSAGIFFKDIKNYWQRKIEVATEEKLARYGLPLMYEGSRWYEYVNIGDGSVTGFEWSYRQDLRYIARWLRGLSIFANGTHLRLGGPHGDDFTSFNPRIINFGIGLTRGKIIARLNVTRRAEIFGGVTATTATNFPSGEYRSYTLPQTIADFSIKYIFSKKFSIYLNTRNLLSSDKITTRIDRDHGAESPSYVYPFVAQRVGAQVVLGVTGRF